MSVTLAASLIAAGGGFAAVCVLWSRGPTAPRLPSWAPLAVAFLGALAASVVHSPPLVGQPTLDVVARALVVLAASLAGAVSPGAPLAAAAVWSAIGSGWFIPSVGAGALVARRMCQLVSGGVIGAMTGAGVGLFALRGSAAALAGVATVLIAGLVCAPRPHRFVARSLAVALLAVVGAGAASALWARDDLTRGLTLTRQALAAAQAGDLAGASADIAQANASLESGRHRLGAWWARPARWVPVLAPNLRAVAMMTEDSWQLTRAGEDLLAAGRVKDLHLTAGRVPVDSLQAAGASLTRAEAILHRTTADAGRVGTTWLVSRVTTRLTEFRARLSSASHSVEIASAAEQLALAMVDGHHRYFLSLTTPAELRGATGFMGNYGVVAADDGKLTLPVFGRMEDLAARSPRHPTSLGWDKDFVAAYGPDLDGSLWQNLTMAPDFPTSAAAIESLYPRSGGQPVDGVVAVDPAGLGAILMVEGAIRVPSWPEPITAANVVPILEHDQYDAFLDPQQRVRFLSDLSHGLVNSLGGARDVGSAGLLRALSAAVRGKHIMIASSDPRLQAQIERLDVGGAMSGRGDDYFGVFSTNSGSNKVDWYLQRSVGYSVALSRSAITATARIALRNSAPSTGEAPYVLVGTNPDLSPGANRQILSIVTPWTLVDATIDGHRSAVSAAPMHGMNLLSVSVEIPAGSERIVTFTLTGLRRASPYHLDVLAQPTSKPDTLSVAVRDGDTPLLYAHELVTSDLHLDQMFHP